MEIQIDSDQGPNKRTEITLGFVNNNQIFISLTTHQASNLMRNIRRELAFVHRLRAAPSKKARWKIIERHYKRNFKLRRRRKK